MSVQNSNNNFCINFFSNNDRVGKHLFLFHLVWPKKWQLVGPNKTKIKWCQNSKIFPTDYFIYSIFLFIVIISKHFPIAAKTYGNRKKLCFTLLRALASSMIIRFSCYDYSHETQELCWYDNQNNSSLPL